MSNTQATELFEAIRPLIEQSIHQGLQKILGEKPNNHNLIYGLRELASFLGCTRSTAIRITKAGKIPYYQVGSTRIYKPDEVLAAMRVEIGETPKYGYKSSTPKKEGVEK
jgi:excisionase family DNA binding protein